MQPLNPQLFNFMQRRFDAVRVANQGIPMAWHWEEGEDGPDISVSPGHEHYVTFCPVCDYRKPTLWVSYMFMQKVNLGGSDNPIPHHILNLACCYHCHCEDERRGIIPRQVWNLGRSTDTRPSSELIKLFEQYFESVGIGRRMLTVDLLPPPTEGSLVRKIPLPNCKSLVDLDPDHAAIEYLIYGRKTPVDPVYLSEVYDVRFCDYYVTCDGPDNVEALTHQRAYNRLIFPFYRDGELVTWQMRVCQPGDTRPRWLFPPGQGQHFYGWDLAKEYQGVILVEGVFDCFAAGPSALGICTSNLNERRCKEIAEQWDYVVIALDPKEFLVEIEEEDGRKRVGHAHVIRERLQKAGLKIPPALVAYPSMEDDPSDMGPQGFDYMLQDSLQALPYHYKAVRTLREEVV